MKRRATTVYPRIPPGAFILHFGAGKLRCCTVVAEPDPLVAIILLYVPVLDPGARPLSYSLILAAELSTLKCVMIVAVTSILLGGIRSCPVRPQRNKVHIKYTKTLRPPNFRGNTSLG